MSDWFKKLFINEAKPALDRHSGGGGGSGGVIDVLELPTENINENAVYRIPVAKYYGPDLTEGNTILCRCVDGLPEICDPLALAGSLMTFYYNLKDDECWFYVDEAALGLVDKPVGWYRFSELSAESWGGVITDASDVKDAEHVYILLTNEEYVYINGCWHRPGIVGVAISVEETVQTDISLDDFQGLTLNFPNVTSIGDSAFTERTWLAGITLPNVTSIGKSAFYKCGGLTSVDLPNATSIEEYAFNRCFSLVSIDMPNVTTVGRGAFQTCISLTSINAPKATFIGDHAFYWCRHLKSINLPNCTEVPSAAFENCVRLASVDLPGATRIGHGAFYCCAGLTSIDLPNVTSIDGCAFERCTGLTSVNIPNVPLISVGAFAGCTSLVSADLHSVTEIRDSAFEGCTNLSAIILRNTSDICILDVGAALDTKIMTKEGMLTGEGFVYIPASMFDAYRAVYEPALEERGMSGAFDLLFRKIEDYPEICGG